jgi:hypothetical protein
MSRDQASRPRHTFGRVLARWAAGKHWHGQPRSDATFWTRGTVPVGERWWGNGRGSWWGMAAGWQRLAVRLVLVAVLIGLLGWRGITEWVLALTGGPAVGIAAVVGWRRLMLRVHRRQLERPLSSALSSYLGISPIAVEAGLEVRQDYADASGGEHVGSLALPDHWAATPDQRRLIEDVIQARFGVDLRYQWQTSRYPMAVSMTRAPVPPVLVPFAEMREAIEACEPGKMLLGVAADGTRRYWDTASEDPHIAIHGGSRRGKTTLLLLTAGQIIRQWKRLPLPVGAPECAAGRVIAIDPKRVSLLALAGVPGVELCNDPRDVAGMWAGVRRFRELVEARYEVLAADPTVEFRRSLLIIDEVSMVSGMWAQHWRHVKERSDPALPPVWDDVAACVWMGAQCAAHVIVAGQRLDYQILGGMIGSFGVRMLAGYGPTDYARLVGVPPFMRSQKPRGRFLLYAGGELDWIQLVFAEPGEVTSWLLEGSADRASDLGAMTGTGTRDGAELVGLPVLVGLAAAAAHLGMEVEAFRKARQRRPVPGEMVGPDGRSPAWPAEALTAWRSDRPSARVAEQSAP